jgi:PTH1 family peptidyl-tRNA hydrolase
MSYTILGLGNPGEEYESTRHNVGAMVLDAFAKKIGAPSFQSDGVRKSLVAKGEIEGEKLILIKPQAFMNKSGVSVRDLAGAKKKIENMVVIHDDLDLPIGSMKIVFDRGSGGHKGVESINRAVKSTAYTRIRIGVCPTTPSGKAKKPDHAKILDFIVGEIKKPEMDTLKKVIKKACEALELIITDSRQKAMTEFN